MPTSAINRDPEILGGIPVFAGTRVPVETWLNCLEKGYTIEEFLDDFPSVSREQMIQVIEEIKERLKLVQPPGSVRRRSYWMSAFPCGWGENSSGISR